MRVCPCVLVAYFGPRDDETLPHFITGNPADDCFGERLWTHKGLSVVCAWAIDYVSCSDVRWVAFGPYASPSEALDGFTRVADRYGRADIRGYRIVNEHCMGAQFGQLESSWWTDG